METHHVVPRIHAEASGTTYVVPRLCEALQAQGVDTHLHVTRKREGQDYSFTLHVYPAWPVPEKLCVSPAMHAGLRRVARRPVILHNHSMWLMPNVYPGLVRAGAACKLVVSPHGTMGAWALSHSRWKKRIIWWLGQRHVMERADCFHATAESEYEEIRARGYRQPVAIIPNGMDLSFADRPLAPRPEGRRRLLFLARLHPKKGLEMLFRAWKRLALQFPDWDLVVAGPEDSPGYERKLKELAAQKALERLTFAGPVYGQNKEDLYFGTDLYVLPTRNENFGITVAEALLAGAPAVVTHGAPWQGLIDHDCGWWVEREEEALTDALRAGMRLSPEARLAMGRRGRAWVLDAFGWPQAAARMRHTYAWILGEGDRPDWVKTS